MYGAVVANTSLPSGNLPLKLKHDSVAARGGPPKFRLTKAAIRKDIHKHYFGDLQPARAAFCGLSLPKGSLPKD
jgi:hypothetical protein